MYFQLIFDHYWSILVILAFSHLQPVGHPLIITPAFRN